MRPRTNVTALVGSEEPPTQVSRTPILDAEDESVWPSERERMAKRHRTSAKDNLSIGRFTWKVVWLNSNRRLPPTSTEYWITQNPRILRTGRNEGSHSISARVVTRVAQTDPNANPATHTCERERTNASRSERHQRAGRPYSDKDLSWALYIILRQARALGHRRRGPDEVESLLRLAGNSRRCEWRGWLLIDV